MIDEKKLLEMRAKVIGGAIAIESIISAAITYHYFGKYVVDFMIEVLFDEYFTSGLKIRILKKAFPKDVDSGTEQNLRRIMNIRNIFAH